MAASFLPRRPGGGGGIILTRDLDEAVAFVNEYAPEHLEVQVREPFALLTRLRNAGEILIGASTPICLGNYCLGTNAILPTGGFAHSFSATSVHDFLKRTGVAYVTTTGYQALEETTRTLAEFEGFPAHAAAVTDRPLPAQPAAGE
jgi:histidinol dehydrogenase